MGCAALFKGQGRLALTGVVVALLLISPAFATDWGLIAMGRSPVEAVLLDLDSVTAHATNKTMWLMVIFPDRNSRGVDSIKNMLTFDCTQRKYSNVDYIEYSGGKVVQETKSQNVQNIVPGTPMDDVFDVVCRNKPVQDIQKGFTEDEIRRRMRNRD